MLLVATPTTPWARLRWLAWNVLPSANATTPNELLGIHVAKSPSTSTVLLLPAQRDVECFAGVSQDWMSAQIGDGEPLDTLVCDGRTLRGTIAEITSAAVRFIAQETRYTQRLGFAIAQNTYATNVVGESAAAGRIASLKRLTA